MMKFKVGDLVSVKLFECPIDCWTLGKVIEIDDDDVIVEPLDKNNNFSNGWEEIRKATVLDYIRTLSAEQIVNNYATVGYHSGCKCCMGCHGGYSCSERKIQWLNQPLTDDIVKQLGGKE